MNVQTLEHTIDTESRVIHTKSQSVSLQKFYMYFRHKFLAVVVNILYTAINRKVLFGSIFKHSLVCTGLKYVKCLESDRIFHASKAFNKLISSQEGNR